MYNFTIYFNNGKKKTVTDVVFYKYENGFIKLNLKDHKSLIFPYTNVNYIEIEGLFEGTEVENNEGAEE